MTGTCLLMFGLVVELMVIVVAPGLTPVTLTPPLNTSVMVHSFREIDAMVGAATMAVTVWSAPSGSTLMSRPAVSPTLRVNDSGVT